MELSRHTKLFLLGAGVIAGGLYLYMHVRKKREDDAHERIKKYEEDYMRTIETIKQKYSLSLDEMIHLKDSVNSVFTEGLESSQNSATIRMLLSHFDKLPTGLEKGISYALDVGGTNVRAIKVRLNGDSTVDMLDVKKEVIPAHLLVGRGEDLFDFIASCLAHVLEPGVDEHNIGFTFSFPIEQLGIASGRLIEWTKGFSASDVPGQDVVALLNKSLEKVGIKSKVSALINDTVGTLIASCYLNNEAQTLAGIILGTGSNAAIVENLCNIPKLYRQDEDGVMIINTEWGNFDSPDLKYLKSTEEDQELDEQSINPGKQYFEKMISGMYLGEIVRLEVNRLSKLSMFNHFGSELFLKPYHFGTEFMSEIENDNTESLTYIKSFLEKLSIFNSTYHERRLLKEICHAVGLRSARLVASAIAAIVERAGKKEQPSIVAVDGALYDLYPRYAENIKDALNEMGFANVSLKLTKDGSGIGAAIAASVVNKV